MYLVAIAWMYVVLMMVVAEALSTQGTVLGAAMTFVLYGLLPLGLVMYILGTPGRRRARRAADNALRPDSVPDSPLNAPLNAPLSSPSDAPDGGGHAAGDTVAPKGKEG